MPHSSQALSISISDASSASVRMWARVSLCIDNTWWLRLLQSLNERQLHKEKIQLLPTIWLRPATWLHFVHEIAVPISWSPQPSWWGLVLAETHPAQWVTLHDMALLGRSFVDCSMNTWHVRMNLTCNGTSVLQCIKLQWLRLEYTAE